MELVKELPEIFEEFAEQRQKSFLVMKEVKDKGDSSNWRVLYIFSTGNCHGYRSCNSRTLFHI